MDDGLGSDKLENGGKRVQKGNIAAAMLGLETPNEFAAELVDIAIAALAKN